MQKQKFRPKSKVSSESKNHTQNNRSDFLYISATFLAVDKKQRISATRPCKKICEAPLLPGNGANSRDKSKFGSVPETSLDFYDNPFKK